MNFWLDTKLSTIEVDTPKLNNFKALLLKLEIYERMDNKIQILI